ncbi:MAG TPA: LD-carboxypeptidase [Thermoanaerobaculia bacterium]|nr:LD-carboxypeptidase [Thermoanaerobaculia bacterium]
MRLRRLRPGDVVGVAALSGPVDPDDLARGASALEAMGYRVRLAPNVGLRSGTLSLAGSDAERLAGYRELLLDPGVAAILFARGGYGVTPLLPRLDPAELAANPKIHCGFSDLTALAARLLARCGLPSFHGPMVAADLARGLDPLSAAFFPSMLEGRGPSSLALPDADVLVPGDFEGPLVGGCLSLLAAAAGTGDEFPYDGSVLLVEDVGEEAYRIDRMLVTLRNAGRLAKLSGILIGSLSAVTFGGVEDPPRLRALLTERLAPLGVPVVAGVPAGHGRPNVALPLGGRVNWDGRRRVLGLPEEIVA